MSEYSKNEQVLQGLTQQEADALMSAGKGNAYQAAPSRSVGAIIRSNTLTLFFMLNLIIAMCLLAVGAYSNALFILFVGVGVAGGTIIEIRARNMVHALTLTNRGLVGVIRGGETRKISPDELVLGDIIKLEAGDQVPADAVVRQGLVEINEALLTGEADLIVKTDGGKLLSGSFVASGACLAQVDHVGADNYITKLAIEAKAYKPVRSEILQSLKTVARFTSRVIVPLGLILLLEALLIRHDPLKEAVISTSAALLGMLPKGLAVLTIIALITAVLKLGRKKILVQEIYSIETMAHVDTLCLDKTGTLTEGKIKVKGINALSEAFAPEYLCGLIGSYIKNSVENNATMRALRDYFPANDLYAAGESIAFASDRKWGAMVLDDAGTLVIGAPERIFDKVPEAIVKKQNEGVRVLGVGLTDQTGLSRDEGLAGVVPAAMILLEDAVRKDAAETLAYLQGQGLALKLISGDHPVTVSRIAQSVGFENYKDYADASGMSEAELRAAVQKTAIFGRVSPLQKKIIVEELKNLGRTVAMTGDGVNDILALREADLSIVMAEGESATKQISNIVLLDSNFSELPHVLFEGRRVVNNMFRVASVFFIKTIYSFFVSILCAASAVTGSVILFPLASLQILVYDQFLEGYPAFFMSFETDRSKIPGKFLKVSLTRALPQALMVTGSLVCIYFLTQAWGWESVEISTVMYYTVGSIMLIGLFKACWPFSKLRLFLFSTSAALFYASAYGLGRWFGSFLHIGLPSQRALGLFACIIACCMVVRIILDFALKAYNNKTKAAGESGRP